MKNAIFVKGLRKNAILYKRSQSKTHGFCQRIAKKPDFRRMIARKTEKFGKRWQLRRRKSVAKSKNLANTGWLNCLFSTVNLHLYHEAVEFKAADESGHERCIVFAWTRNSLIDESFLVTESNFKNQVEKFVTKI